jgi:undecaprenyl-diphosphatase
MAERIPSRSRWVLENMVAALRLLVRPAPGSTKPVWRAYRRVVAGAVMAVAILLLIMVFLDVAVIRTAIELPLWLVAVFRIVSDLGLSGWFLIPLGIALLLIAFATPPSLSHISRLVMVALSVRLGFLFLAIAVPGLVVTIAKRIIGRARPLFSDGDAFLYHVLLWRPSYASLPSGHATTAFAALFAFGVLWPKLRPLLWTYAVMVALSRVMLAAHYPSDVVAGAIAGLIGTVLVRDWLAARRLGFVIRADGSVLPLAGPSLVRIKRVARELAGQ